MEDDNDRLWVHVVAVGWVGAQFGKKKKVHGSHPSPFFPPFSLLSPQMLARKGRASP